MPAKKKSTRTTKKTMSAKRTTAKRTTSGATAARASPERAPQTAEAREKMLFTRDEEHQILVRVVDKFLLFGFAMVGVGWYWLTTKVLVLDDLQEAVMLSGFGIVVMLLIFSLISRDYEFRRDHVRKS